MDGLRLTDPSNNEATTCLDTPDCEPTRVFAVSEILDGRMHDLPRVPKRESRRMLWHPPALVDPRRGKGLGAHPCVDEHRDRTIPVLDLGAVTQRLVPAETAKRIPVPTEHPRRRGSIGRSAAMGARDAM